MSREDRVRTREIWTTDDPANSLIFDHSWPIFERDQRFDLGLVMDCSIADSDPAGDVGLQPNAGWWECDLATNALSWSNGVYDLFGLPRGAVVTRPEAVAMYCEHSRAAMERLRTHSIRHNRGFTLDIDIRPAVGAASRRLRLIAAPDYRNDQPVRLYGMKIPI